MPIVDKRSSEPATYKVAKRGLDPFAKRRQAVSLVRRRQEAPASPNSASFDYNVTEHEGHFEISVRQSRGKGARAKGLDKNADKRQGRAPQAKRSELEDPLSVADGMLSADGPGRQAGSGTYDIEGRLGMTYSKPELRDRARRAGVHVTQNMSKSEIARAMADQAPRRSRSLVGRL